MKLTRFRPALLLCAVLALSACCKQPPAAVVVAPELPVRVHVTYPPPPPPRTHRDGPCGLIAIPPYPFSPWF